MNEARLRLGARLCKACDLGIGGNMYGGRLLEWFAEQAALHAQSLTGEAHLLGYRFDGIRITAPVHAGDALEYFAAGAPRFGRTSVTFELEVRVGEQTVMCGECTFVAVDSAGRKKPITPRA